MSTASSMFREYGLEITMDNHGEAGAYTHIDGCGDTKTVDAVIWREVRNPDNESAGITITFTRTVRIRSADLSPGVHEKGIVGGIEYAVTNVARVNAGEFIAIELTRQGINERTRPQYRKAL